MFSMRSLTACDERERSLSTCFPTDLTHDIRRVALLRSGRPHGPITRLITPWDIGALTQPFVFLCYATLTQGARTVIGGQPGIGILTLVLSGTLAFEDVAGKGGVVVAGGFQWTIPGEVVWQAACGRTGEPLRAFQLWVVLPTSLASSAGEGQSIGRAQVSEEGPARVALGQLGRARSPLAQAPPDINYFHVRLRDRQRWRYAAPAGHNVTWIAVDQGGVCLLGGERVYRDQIALFGDSRGVMELRADGETSLVLGSAPRSLRSLTTEADFAIDSDLLSTETELGTAGRRLLAQSPR